MDENKLNGTIPKQFGGLIGLSYLYSFFPFLLLFFFSVLSFLPSSRLSSMLLFFFFVWNCLILFEDHWAEISFLEIFRKTLGKWLAWGGCTLISKLRTKKEMIFFYLIFVVLFQIICSQALFHLQFCYYQTSPDCNLSFSFSIFQQLFFFVLFPHCVFFVVVFVFWPRLGVWIRII